MLTSNQVLTSKDQSMLNLRITLETNPDCQFTIYGVKTVQNAVRLAFRKWIKDGLISRQPRTTSNGGGFEGVVVEIL